MSENEIAKKTDANIKEDLKKSDRATSALVASFQYEVEKISNLISKLDDGLKNLYSVLDIRLDSDDVKKVLELEEILDESTQWLADIRKDIDGTSQSVKNLSEEISVLKEQNKKNKESIESMRGYIINAAPSVYDVVGLVGAAALVSTSIFIYLDKWNIIRTWYYPMAFGILIAIAATATIINQRKQRRRLFGGKS